MNFQLKIMIVDRSGSKRTATVSGHSRQWTIAGNAPSNCALKDSTLAPPMIVLKLSEGSESGLPRTTSSRSVMAPTVASFPQECVVTWGRDSCIQAADCIQVSSEDMVNIFETGPDVEIATVAEQKAFWSEWHQPR